MKSAWAIHARVCRRVSTKPYVTSPESSMYGVGEVDFEAAHRQLKGEYCLGEDGKAMMREPYESEVDRPDYFLILPEGARKLVVEYMDVKSLCRADQVMSNVYTLMAWLDALKGTLSVALSRWPHYSDKDNYAGLRWSMNRRMRAGASIRFRKIWSAPSCDVSDKASVFQVLSLKKKSAEIACYLVGEGWIDPNSSLRIEKVNHAAPILHVVSIYGRPLVVKALLQAGADIDKATDKGGTPLMMASGQGHGAIVEVLIQAGADIDKVDINGMTAVMAASQNGHSAIVEALIQAGADIDKVDINGITAVMAASRNGHSAIVEALIQAGADIDKANNVGATALMWASGKGQAAIVETLIQAGADIDKATNKGGTALMWASENGHSAIVEALIQAGADIDKVDINGTTASMAASRNGHSAIVEALIQAGADIDKTANNGATALILASKMGHTAIVKALKEAGTKK
jgi:ankyrin repeat protein